MFLLVCGSPDDSRAFQQRTPCQRSLLHCQPSSLLVDIRRLLARQQGKRQVERYGSIPEIPCVSRLAASISFLWSCDRNLCDRCSFPSSGGLVLWLCWCFPEIRPGCQTVINSFCLAFHSLFGSLGRLLVSHGLEILTSFSSPIRFHSVSWEAWHGLEWRSRNPRERKGKRQ